MRRPGQLQNPRDERNWMIPREGTIRRAVYDALTAGRSINEICASLEITRRACEAHKAYIVNWQKRHVWRSVSMQRDAA